MKAIKTILFVAAIALASLSSAQDQAEMMEAWMAAATPGAPHERLAEQAGTWNAVVEAWMEPGAEPMVSESAVERVMSLDGRVLEERWSGTMMGMPFKGYGRTGYDNITQKYWSTWTDNMSTGLMTFTGQYDEEAEEFVFHGSYVDPMSEETVDSRSVATMPEDDKEMMVMYETHDGEEIMTMRMSLTRQ